MRVAAHYDIHGNLPALEAALAEVDSLGCDLILVGGDAALGPMARETLDLLIGRGEQVRFIRGNCDREMVSALEREPDPSKVWEFRLRWAAERITPAQRDLLTTLPVTMNLEIDGQGRPGAYWVRLGLDVTLMRTPYDVERAAQGIRASGFPEAEEFTRKEVLAPAAAAEASEYFEKMAEERARSRPAD